MEGDEETPATVAPFVAIPFLATAATTRWTGGVESKGNVVHRTCVHNHTRGQAVKGRWM